MLGRGELEKICRCFWHSIFTLGEQDLLLHLHCKQQGGMGVWVVGVIDVHVQMHTISMLPKRMVRSTRISGDARAAGDSQATKEASEDVRVKSELTDRRFKTVVTCAFYQENMLILNVAVCCKKKRIFTDTRKGLRLSMVKIPSCLPRAQMSMHTKDGSSK